MANGRDLISEYEREREKNIKELQGEFGHLFESVQKSASCFSTSCKSINKFNSISQSLKRRIELDPDTPTPRIKIVRRSSRLRTEKRKTINYNELSDDDDKNQKNSLQGSFRVKFSGFKNKNNKPTDEAYYNDYGDSDFVDSDEDYIEEVKKVEVSSKKKIRTRKNVQTPRLDVSQVTQEMLNNILYVSSAKVLDDSGTCCHQCRQKTLDQKTYCRHKKCKGVRGMFCGFCLINRYGEDVAKALLDPKWACPLCRRCCNCSICRRKEGKIPTGQLAVRAIAEGYKSVKDMLDDIEGKNPEISSSSDSEFEEDNGGISDEECEQNDNNVVTHEHTKTEQLNDKTVNTETENEVVDMQLETNKHNMANNNEYESSSEDENEGDSRSVHLKQLFLSTSRVHSSLTLKNENVTNDKQ